MASTLEADVFGSRAVLLRVTVLLMLCSLNLPVLSDSAGLMKYSDLDGEPYTISYDNRSFFINGKRTLFLSGAVHYPRSLPDAWPRVLEEMTNDGLNMLQTYVFWSLHEPQRGQPYNFESNANLTHFIELAAASGLFVNLRIGPYVAAEWTYGGLPAWLNEVPGIQLRSNNSVWEMEMSRFVTDIAKLVEPYLSRNGGPIVMAQIENEYHWDDSSYVEWCGKLVESLHLDIPWLMCNGNSAKNVINTCNGNDCTKYAESHAKNYPGQPLVWTENEGWYQEWSRPSDYSWNNRSPQDMAFVILKWIARGGAHHNYYMWYGGSNFGRWGGSAITPMYADGVNLHSDGLPNEPKKSHLQLMHQVLAHSADILLSAPSQINNSFHLLVYDNSSKTWITGTHQIAFLYRVGSQNLSFVENDAANDCLVQYNGKVIYMPSESVAIVDSSNTVVYHSGIIRGPQNYTREYVSTGVLQASKWSSWVEPFNFTNALKARYPLEQLSVTHDTTDYLFYVTSVLADTSGDTDVEIGALTGSAFSLFVDGKLVGGTDDRTHSWGPVIELKARVPVDKGQHELAILSVSLGIITHLEPKTFNFRGIVRGVQFAGKNITNSLWRHQPGLVGEKFKVFTESGAKTVTWSRRAPTSAPLTWYMTRFNAPPPPLEKQSLLLDLGGMTRGHVYVNGFDLGRYWLAEVEGKPVQRHYLLPFSLLVEKDNLLVVFDELGIGDPHKISVVYSQIMSS